MDAGAGALEAPGDEMLFVNGAAVSHALHLSHPLEPQHLHDDYPPLSPAISDESYPVTTDAATYPPALAPSDAAAAAAVEAPPAATAAASAASSTLLRPCKFPEYKH